MLVFYAASESRDDKLLEIMAKHETKDDNIFQKFKEKTSLEPEQVQNMPFLQSPFLPA